MLSLAGVKVEPSFEDTEGLCGTGRREIRVVTVVCLYVDVLAFEVGVECIVAHAGKMVTVAIA